MRWIGLPIAELVVRYGAGESTRMLGCAYGAGQMTIWRRLVAAGVKMRSAAEAGGGAGAPHKRGGAFHRAGTRYLATLGRGGKQCLVHRGCWEAYHGEIPDECVIHHIDGNPTNNDIGNLQCMSDSEHKRLHTTKWHRTRGHRMRKSICTLALVFCIMVAPIMVAYGADAEKDPFDDWWGLVELQAGSTWNFSTQEWKPYFSTLLVGYRAVRLVGGAELEADEPVAGLLGVTYNLGSLKDMGVDVPWMEHFGFNIGPAVRYEFATGEVEWTAMLSIVDLSFSDGNADRQKKR